MDTASQPRDAVGSDTLAALADADNYNAWQVAEVRSYLGKRIIEIGSGIGNISRQLHGTNPERLILTDLDPWYRDRLSERFHADPRVAITELILPSADAGSRFGDEMLDTALAFNVIEHIEDDVGAVQTMADTLQPGGRVIILVPALQAIYGRMDEELGHYRRYDKGSLGALLESAGLQVQMLRWFNRAVVIPWWWRGKVMRRPALDAGGIDLFDRLVPLFRLERFLPLPFGQSVIGVGRRSG